MYVYIYIYIYIYMYVFFCTLCTHIYIYIYIHTYICIYIYTHTYVKVDAKHISMFLIVFEHHYSCYMSWHGKGWWTSRLSVFFLARRHFPKNRETCGGWWANGKVYIKCYIYILPHDFSLAWWRTWAQKSMNHTLLSWGFHLDFAGGS